MTRYASNQVRFSPSTLLVTLFQLKQRGVGISTFRLARELGVTQQQIRVALVTLAKKGLVVETQLTWFGLAAASALAAAPARSQHQAA